MTGNAPLLDTALTLAARGIPPLPLRAGKVPFGNCRTCARNACGGRPNMKTPGPCQCPGVCHAWAAAATDPHVLNSPQWQATWRQAAAIAYHPGGAGLTVVDLDNAAAIAWARDTLPATRTVSTTRGEHWIYRGVMPSRNNARPGSTSSPLWHTPVGSDGAPAPWPLSRTRYAPLALTDPPAARRAPQAVSAPLGGQSGVCCHRSPVFPGPGDRDGGAEHHRRPGGGCTRPSTGRSSRCCPRTAGAAASPTPTSPRLFTAAQAKGETARHCTDAWTNALTTLGL